MCWMWSLYFKLVKVHDAEGYDIDELPKTVIKNTITRKLKITANKINPFTKTR